MLPITFLGLFVSLAVLRAVHQCRGKDAGAPDPAQVSPEGGRLDRIRRVLTACLSCLVVIHGFHHVFGLFPWFARGGLPVPEPVRWLGCAGAVAALVMLHQVHRDLGRAFSVRLLVRENHPLVTNGWYARIRHPMYSALGAFFLCASLVAAHAWIAILAAGIVAVLCARTGAEERMMEAHFGETYRRYRENTGLLWPRFTRRTRKD
ncbi:MAG: isoprenylcysteine carboxylmethyltransferase family protein [Verrucomicrobia bacterium]|nr:isoprenylcysteine carboxylmethyltransferase family protein [Verrucomicrobiota bacterium]